MVAAARALVVVVFPGAKARVRRQVTDKKTTTTNFMVYNNKVRWRKKERCLLPIIAVEVCYGIFLQTKMNFKEVFLARKDPKVTKTTHIVQLSLPRL